ncbi:hypothetical protein EDD21DRAFT_350104 [Dissophora ornata]|nr:hypothetical protein EDD21DRAFT_350104 [Dissophora ornata]
MKSFRSAISLLLIMTVVTFRYSPSGPHHLGVLAAPITSPSSSPRTSTSTPPGLVASAECRACLSQGLHKVGACDKLDQNTPILAATERDSVKIAEYKAKYPDAVNCLCMAASRSKGANGWVEKCDAVCTGAVEKYQKRVLSNFAKMFSCDKGNSSDAPASKPVPKKGPAPSLAPAVSKTVAPVLVAKPKPTATKVPATTPENDKSGAKKDETEENRPQNGLSGDHRKETPSSAAVPGS